jgi:serine/threonine-protein kinase
MPLSIPEFWNLTEQARLLSAEQRRTLDEAFSRVKGAEHGNAKTLCEWLVAENVLSPYQTKVLLAGVPGPFVYGEYSVYDHVETGPLAGLYRASHLPTGHVVLLNFLRGAGDDPQRWRQMIEAVAAARAIRHPHLLRYYEAVEFDRFKFFVMEEVRGQALDDLANEGRPMPPGDARRIVRQIALAFEELHRQGRIAGPTALDGVIVTAAGNVKLLFNPTQQRAAIDWRHPSAAPLAERFADYLAPELAQSGRAPDRLSDVYNLGCILYRLLAGRAPFAGGGFDLKMARHAGEAIVPLEQFGVERTLAAIVPYMMAKNPAIRYPSAQAVADAIASAGDPAAVAMIRPEPSLATLPAYEAYLAQRPVGASPGMAPVHVASAQAPVVNIAASSAPSTTSAFSPKNAGPIAVGGERSTAPAAAASASPSGSPVVSRRRSSSNLFTTAALTALIVAVLGGGVYVLSDKNPDVAENNPASSTAGGKKGSPTKGGAATAKTSMPDDDGANPKTQGKQPDDPPESVDPKALAKLDRPELPIADDGKTLWASPTWGAPIDLKYVALGAKGALVVRPKNLLAHPYGAATLAAFGPAGEETRANLEKTIGVPLEQIERLVVAFYPHQDEFPSTTYVVELAAPRSRSEWSKSWSDVSEAIYNGEKIFASEETAYYLPKEAENRIVAVGSIDAVKEIVDRKGAAPPLGQLDALLKTSDSDRQLTILAAPQFLFGDGRKIFAGAAEQIRDPLAAFLGDDLRATAFSLHLDGEDAFIEWRTLSSIERKPQQAVDDYLAKIGDLRGRVEDFLATLNASPHAKKMMLRYPGMIAEAALNTRGAVEDQQAVLRAYIYAAGPWNLLKATELALSERLGAGAVATEAPAVAAEAKTVEEKLKRPISLSFPRDTLEKSVEMWAAEAGLTATIIGGDLQLEGITKNQSFDLDEREQTADSVLRTILKKASPDGKLIYVVKPEKPGGDPIVWITTFAAATKRGDPIPPGFVAPATKDGK